jgi:hypothetical protein
MATSPLLCHSYLNTVDNVLNVLRRFDVAATLPELQHQICALWARDAILFVQQLLASVASEE